MLLNSTNNERYCTNYPGKFGYFCNISYRTFFNNVIGKYCNNQDISDDNPWDIPYIDKIYKEWYAG